MTSPALPLYLRKLHDWPDLETEDFDKPWKEFRPFLEAHGYALYGSDEYNKRSMAGCCPTKVAKDPFNPADDEDFVHRTCWIQGKLLLGHYLQMKSSMHLAADRFHRNVFLEVVPLDSPTYRILHILSTNPLRVDPRNHTIPHVKFIPAGERWMFISQAWWGMSWDQPTFDSMHSRLEVARQLIEGVAFMHENGIGHGDIHPHNILFNHDNCRALKLRQTGDSNTPIVPFHSTFDFRMAFIDFECAVHFGRGIDALVRPGNIPPSDIAAPEQANLDGGEYDLFKADVFNLGRTLTKEIQEASASNHGALNILSEQTRIRQYEKLLNLMTRENPGDRPTAAKAYEMLMLVVEG